MNLNTANLKVAMAASTDACKLSIQNIHVTQTYTEATNGAIFARVSLPLQFDCGDVPAVCPTLPAEHIKPFLVPAAAAMKIKPLKCKRLPILDGVLYVDVAATNQNGSARFVSTDTESVISPELYKVDANFPDVNRVIPKDDPSFHVKLTIGHLETLLQIAKATGSEYVTVDGFGKSGSAFPLVLKAEKDGQTFLGVIMPCRE
jgi:hypothetical protein